MVYRGVAGGDEELAGKGKFRILRDGIQIAKMYQPGKRRGTCSVDEVGEVHVVDRVGKLERPRCGAVARRTGRQGIPRVFKVGPEHR